MDEMMNFPDDWHDFIKSNSFVDSEKIYTNGALLMTELRVEQLVEHILREKEQQWVSIKDRLPKDGQDVLAYLNDGEETRIAPCHYYNGVWFDSVMNCVVVLQDVTHWMPLPSTEGLDET